MTFRSFTKNLPHSPLGDSIPEQSGGVRASNSPKSHLMPPKKGQTTLRAVQLYSCAQNRPSAASETPGRAHPGASGPFPPAPHTLGTLWPAGLAGGDLWGVTRSRPAGQGRHFSMVVLARVCGSPAGDSGDLCRHQRDGIESWGVLRGRVCLPVRPLRRHLEKVTRSRKE